MISRSRDLPRALHSRNPMPGKLPFPGPDGRDPRHVAPAPYAPFRWYDGYAEAILPGEASMGTLQDLFERLWKDYSALNPQAGRIHALLEARGETILNDHIAFRTFAHPGMDIP